MNKRDLDIARMYRYILHGCKFSFLGIREYNGQSLKMYCIRNADSRGLFYVSADTE